MSTCNVHHFVILSSAGNCAVCEMQKVSATEPVPPLGNCPMCQGTGHLPEGVTPQQQQTEELKPCPFCGGKAKAERVNMPFFGVRCCDCGAEVGRDFDEPTSALTAMWNRRAVASREATPEEIAEFMNENWSDYMAYHPQEFAKIFIERFRVFPRGEGDQ